MELGRIIMLTISLSLTFILAIPFIIRLVRQLIAIKHGKQYSSTRVGNDNSGRLFVDWTDENGEKHSKIFDVIKRNYRSLTEVTVYSYKKMLSLGKMSILSDVFIICVILLCMIFFILYVVLH